jgi:glycosyltransferase involved in cell wall biosynthesis
MRSRGLTARVPCEGMKILHTVAGLWEGTGGPVSSVTSLCAGLAARGHQITLLTGKGPMHTAVSSLGTRVRVRTEPLGPYRAGHWSPAFRRACLEEARQADVVHDHGVWLHTNWSSVQMAHRAGRPVVRSPRGMLSPWALARSRVSKKALWVLFERRLFQSTALVHVTSELEQTEIEGLGIATPSVVIPNGVDLDGEYSPSSLANAREESPTNAAGRRVVLFLSRIHPKKGLDLLCRMWAELPREEPAALWIAGPGDRVAIEALQRWIDSQPGPPASYLGQVDGARKLALLSSAWLMALPSYSENYGMVVAEALACGTPVLTTTGMPWSATTAAGCGWVVAPGSADLAGALRAALALSNEEHEAMSGRARALVTRTHSLERTVDQMEARYQSLLNGNAQRPGA